jgi:hypothetical protein
VTMKDKLGVMGLTLSMMFSLMGGFWWVTQNVVWAADFSEYATGHKDDVGEKELKNEIRWLTLENDRLWDEYRDYLRIQPTTSMIQERMLDLQRRMDIKKDKIQSLENKE